MSIEALQEYTRISRYARFNTEKGRRETWNEQIKRVINMHREKYSEFIPLIEEELSIAEDAMKRKLVLGSQRALQFGGKSILRKESKIYNCTVSYADRPRFFQEALWLLLCGCGVGFSVQKEHIQSLPDIAPVNEDIVYTIPDSIEGWSDAIGVLLSSYFTSNQPFAEFFGKKVIFDYSQIRPAGSPLSDTNSKAPGPDGLTASIERIRQLIEARLATGETRLHPIDAYDIIMHSSDAVLSGGVRRSATICIFSKDDEEMLKAKTGDWFITNPQRGRSNNSALLLRNNTSREEFADVFKNVKEFGEPGFIWSDSIWALYNPCVEIGMYAKDDKGNSGWSFCNLCEINVKKAKTREDFLAMCKAASILGTLQAGYSTFSYLFDSHFGYNVTEEIVRKEALLGCSMTGMMDNPDIAFNAELQKEGAEYIKQINAEFAPKIGINIAARTTCVKPAGSTSCILGTASGIHPHHAKRYFRRIQVNKREEPLNFFRIFNEQAVTESVWSTNRTDDVITFLCEVPSSARIKNDISAIDLLKYVQLTQQNWVEYGTRYENCAKPWLRHNVSNTINVRDNEWDEVEEYIYSNRNWFAGISLLSMTGDKDYDQAPFQAVYTPEELVKMYGDCSVFASGMIVRALNAFDNNLFKACDCLLGIGEKLPETINLSSHNAERHIKSVLAKKKWIDDADKFISKYFLPQVLLDKYGFKSISELKDSEHSTELYLKDTDEWRVAMKKMTYCLKDVDAWKTWIDLKSTYTDVPWNDFYEQFDNTKVSETIACSGGACEITKM